MLRGEIDKVLKKNNVGSKELQGLLDEIERGTRQGGQPGTQRDPKAAESSDADAAEALLRGILGGLAKPEDAKEGDEPE